MFVCGLPGSGSSPAPTPPPPSGGSPGLNPGGNNGGGTTPAPKKDTAPPRVTITSPASGANTSTSVTVSALVTDNVKVKMVELRVDGIVLASRSTGPFTFKVVLKAGSRLIKVTGRDTSGLVSHATVRITVTSTSSGGATPAPAPPSINPGTGSATNAGTFGATCSSPDQCLSKLCATDLTLGTSYCTQDCTTMVCPDGAGCFSSTGGMSICAPLASGDGSGYSPAAVAGSGCSIGSGARGAAPGALILLALCSLLLLRRRRR